MNEIAVKVAADLRIDGYELPGNLSDQIYDELTIVNQEKIVAKRMKRWKWEELPDSFHLAEWDGAQHILPRGYAFQLKLLLRENGYKVRWNDHRKWECGQRFAWCHKFVPREHQVEAVRRIRKHQQGIYEAPTGSGKTLTAIKLIHDISPKKSIILVDQLGLLNQWIKEVGNWLGAEHVGQIGSGTWADNKRITIATIQSIWSALKNNKIDESWFNQFDLVDIDECHHIPAVTLRSVVSRFPARYRFGKSATPDRKDGKFEFALNILGEVFHQEDENTLRARGILIKPVVKAVKTDFKFNYWGDHESDQDGNCEKPNCNIFYSHSHKNNYQKLKTALVHDPNRNKKILHTLMNEVSNGQHIHLIVSNEIRHLDAIEDILNTRFLQSRRPSVYRLTGQSKGKVRREIVTQIKNSKEAIILATVAKEGLDIPGIDRMYLAFPSSSGPGTKQRVGRATRILDGKKGAIIFDFVDEQVDVLRKQFAKRCHGFYYKSGIEVIK